MKVDLAGQVALVTGAARGIGQAIADELAANGARVVYTDLDARAAEAAAARAPGAKAWAMNVTDAVRIDEVTAAIIDEFGRLDILVNNAGINTMQHRVTIDEFPPDEWDRIVNVDLRGVFLVSRAAARVMLPRGRGGSLTSRRLPAWFRYVCNARLPRPRQES